MEAFGWRAIFVGQVPLVLLALVFAYRLLPDTPRSAHGSFDLAGAALVALGVTPLLFALSEGPRLGWSAPAVVASLVLGPAALWAFVRVERRAEHPLLPLRYLGRPGFTFSIISQAVLTTAKIASARTAAPVSVEPVHLA